MPDLTLTSIIQDSQHVHNNQTKLQSSLAKLYNGSNEDEFCEEFLKVVKCPMIVFKREPNVERIIEFICKFAASTLSKDGQLSVLLIQFFNFLLATHNACEKAVRFRVCQMLTKLLADLGEDTQLDEDLYQKLVKCLLQRLRDKIPAVRAQAAYALFRLQDPTDKNCPVISAYLFLMSRDPHPEVRHAILSVIMAYTKTFSAILERTRDVKEIIRKTAFRILAEKVHVKSLTIAHRVRILKEGLKNRSTAIQDVCSQKLLKSWVKMFQGNLLDFLKCLDVENSSEVSQLALQTIFKWSNANELIKNFDLITEKHVIDLSSLNCENALYWRCLCEHIKSLKDVAAEEKLEQLLPTLTEYCSYVQEFFETPVDDPSDPNNLVSGLQHKFIGEQLLNIITIMDLAEEAGRRQVEKLIFHLLLTNQHLHLAHLNVLLKLLGILEPKETVRIRQLAEIIADITEPITVQEVASSPQQMKENSMKIAKIRVEVNELKDKLETCIHKQEFGQAAEIKQKLEELEEQEKNIKIEMEPKTEEIRTEKKDSNTSLKCLGIVYEYLQSPEVKILSETVQSLIETLVIPCIQMEDPAIRNLALKCLGLGCHLSLPLASQHLLLFIQISKFDLETIQVTALQIIFDLIMIFGLEAFKLEETDQEDIEKDAIIPEDDTDQSQKEETPATQLIATLTSLLDSETSEIRSVVAEGFAKLMICGRLLSSRLVSRLLLMWYNPITEDDVHMRHCLGSFFPCFAFANSTYQQCLEEAILPTIQTLVHAPSSSPLSDINSHNVADFLIQLTNSSYLNKTSNLQEAQCHDILAVRLCNEILKDPESDHIVFWAKMLKQLSPVTTNPSTLKDLLNLTNNTLKAVRDKGCIKSIEKFVQNLNQAMKNNNINNETTNEIINKSLSLSMEKTNSPEETQSILVDCIESNQLKSTQKTTKKSSLDKTPAPVKNSRKDSNPIFTTAKKAAKWLTTTSSSDSESSIFVTPQENIRRSTRTRRNPVTQINYESD